MRFRKGTNNSNYHRCSDVPNFFPEVNVFKLAHQNKLFQRAHRKGYIWITELCSISAWLPYGI